MKACYFFTILFICLFAQAQQTVRFRDEPIYRGFTLYAANDAGCPITVELALYLDNLTFSAGQKRFFVVPAKAKQFKLGDLKAVDGNQRYTYTSTVRLYYGNVLSASYDSSYAYGLPFGKDKFFRLIQGYDGAFSHKNQNALDFAMPEETPVLAARDGIVISVIQQHTENCLRQECKSLANAIMVYHADGTIGNYVHLRHNGALVKEGDHVQKGDPLGYSGNTGYSTTPHLHFHCALPDTSQLKTISTKFVIVKDSAAVNLQPGRFYLNMY